MSAADPLPPFRYIYQDESGDVARTNCNFIVGLLLVRDLGRLRAAVAEARREFHFENELHFVKMSALRERVYRAVFGNLAAVRDEFEFHAILVRHELLEIGWFSGRRHLAYNFFTKLLLQRHVEGIAEATIYADAKTRLKEDTFLVYLPSELNLTAGRYVIKHVTAIDSKSDDVLQAADLLTGCANVVATRKLGGRKHSVCEEAIRLGVFDPTRVWDWRP